MSEPPKLPPHIEKGVFSVTVSTDIDAPIDKVWNIILDFPSYHEWNPFARHMTIVTSSKKRESDQTAAPGKYVIIECNIPPSMEDTQPKQAPHEIITVVDHDGYRVAWANVDYPQWLLRAERWQTLSTVDGKTRYETSEVFAGSFAYLVKWFFRAGVERGFAEMAEGLKRRSEQP